MTQLVGFSVAKLLLLLVKMFIEIFPFIYIQYDLLERLERKHFYTCSLYNKFTKNRFYKLYIVIHQSCRVGIIFFGTVEGLKTLISWRIIPSIKYHFKNHSIRKQRKRTGIPGTYHTYIENFLLKMNKKLSLVPVSLVTLLNKIKKHRLSVTVE